VKNLTCALLVETANSIEYIRVTMHSSSPRVLTWLHAYYWFCTPFVLDIL